MGVIRAPTAAAAPAVSPPPPALRAIEGVFCSAPPLALSDCCLADTLRLGALLSLDSARDRFLPAELSAAAPWIVAGCREVGQASRPRTSSAKHDPNLDSKFSIKIITYAVKEVHMHKTVASVEN